MTNPPESAEFAPITHDSSSVLFGAPYHPTNSGSGLAESEAKETPTPVKLVMIRRKPDGLDYLGFHRGHLRDIPSLERDVTHKRGINKVGIDHKLRVIADRRQPRVCVIPELDG